METFLFVANSIFVATYLVNDLVRIRLLSMFATVCLIVYFAGQAEPMVTVIAWNLVFLALNAAQIGRLLLARRAEPTPLAS